MSDLLQFGDRDLHSQEREGRISWWFECSLSFVFRQRGIMDVEDNYEVEERLRRAGVIKHNNLTATETCAMVVCFSSRVAARNFIGRLNEYIQTKVALVRAAEEF